ncbi:MAG TPA: hypothetical protein VF654_17970, partial [Pyrinomonadaceae bacterium]
MPENSSPNTRTLAVGAACLVVGLLAGFFVTNAINRDEQEKLRAEVTSLRAGGAGAGKAAAQRGGGGGQQQQTSAAGDDSFPTLSDDQLANAVAKADAAPQDSELQRKVGQALYVYAWQSGNAAILPDVARILRRAHDLDPKD